MGARKKQEWSGAERRRAPPPLRLLSVFFALRKARSLLHSSAFQHTLAMCPINKPLL